MGIVADKLDNLVVTATSPDGRISARLSHRSKLHMKFLPGTFDRYTEGSLQPQLARTATTLWVNWQRDYAATLKPLGMTVLTREVATDEATRIFLTERFDIQGHGMSPDRVVQAKTRGLREWEFRIKPGTMAKVPEEQLITEILSAAAKARVTYTAKLEALKKKLFE